MNSAICFGGDRNRMGFASTSAIAGPFFQLTTKTSYGDVVPIDELSDRVIIRTLGALRAEAINNGGLCEREIWQSQDSFGFSSFPSFLLHRRRPPFPPPRWCSQNDLLDIRKNL